MFSSGNSENIGVEISATADVKNSQRTSAIKMLLTIMRYFSKVSEEASACLLVMGPMLGQMMVQNKDKIPVVLLAEARL